jgi:hypothetical protein
MPLLALAPVQKHQDRRCLVAEVEELLDQCERRPVGPVQVFEHETQRLFAREGLEQGRNRLEGLALDGVAAQVLQPPVVGAFERDAEQRAEKR